MSKLLQKILLRCRDGNKIAFNYDKAARALTVEVRQENFAVEWSISEAEIQKYQAGVDELVIDAIEYADNSILLAKHE